MKILRLSATVSLIGVLVTVLSCGSREDDPGASLVGVWLTDDYIRKEFTRFNDDGTVEVFHMRVGGQPYSKGEWEMRDDGHFYWRFTSILHEGEYKRASDLDGTQAWDKFSLALSDDGDRATLTRHQTGRLKFTNSTLTWQRVENPPE